jgi:hypothetical protein
MSLLETTFVKVPPKSKLMLPPLASIRYENLPPGLRSISALGQCQSSEAAFHC